MDVRDGKRVEPQLHPTDAFSAALTSTLTESSRDDSA
jgi:hypothetical protein